MLSARSYLTGQTKEGSHAHEQLYTDIGGQMASGTMAMERKQRLTNMK